MCCIAALALQGFVTTAASTAGADAAEQGGSSILLRSHPRMPAGAAFRRCSPSLIILVH